MSRRLTPAALVWILACSGGGGGSGPVPADRAPIPEAAVRNFMQAVADSNITRMGRYWGTSKGPAAIVRQPADYVQRLQIMRSFLQGAPYRMTHAGMVASDSGRVLVQVELDRVDGGGERCTKSVPFTVIRTGNYGWIIESIEILKAGTPGRACRGPRDPAPSP